MARSKTSTSDAERRSKYATNFGAALATQLTQHRMTQADLATALTCSVAYANQTMTGVKSASPKFVDKVSDALNLTVPDRQALHYAAAVDKGYRLDLTKKK